MSDPKDEVLMAFPHETNIKTAQSVKPGWPFYAAWIVLTALCFPFSFLLEFPILAMANRLIGDFIYVNGVRHVTEDYLFFYTFVPVVGLLTGIIQYLLLRRHLPRMGGWIVATVGGWILAMFLVGLLNRLPQRYASYNLDLVFITIGLSLGTVQWLLLRRRLTGPVWWILANALGWMFVGWIIPGNSVDQYGLFILGLVPASATALMLAVLMKQVQPELMRIAK